MNIHNFEIIQKIPSFENKIYIVRKNTSDYIFKIISSDNAFKKELETLCFLQGNNISPNIIDFNIDNNSLLIELLNGNIFNYSSRNDIIIIGKLLRKLHDLLADFDNHADNEIFTINDCLKNINHELGKKRSILNLEEKSILLKTLEYLDNLKIENESKTIIHNDIKPENIIGNKFIDFEKTGKNYLLKDIARAIIRIGKGDLYFENTLLKTYGIKNENRDLELLKIQDCLFSISYYIYKGYRNNYPFKDISFKILNDILN